MFSDEDLDSDVMDLGDEDEEYDDVMPDDETDEDELAESVKFSKYKTRNHLVFSVFRGTEHWKRLSSRIGKEKVIWLKCRAGKRHIPAERPDLSWLEDVFDSV